jgi:hypothetical protein
MVLAGADFLLWTNSAGVNTRFGEGDNFITTHGWRRAFPAVSIRGIEVDQKLIGRHYATRRETARQRLRAT